MRVAGKVLIDSNVDTFCDASLHIYVEDAGLLDESAIRLASQRIDHVSHQKGTMTAIPFVMNFTVKDPRSDHIMRAHISISGNLDINQGDLVTTQAFSVNLLSQQGDMILPIQKVI